MARLATLVALLLPLVAGAADTPYCQRVRARVRSEAARLMSPQLVVQGLRFPRSLSGLPLADLETTSLTPYQARAGLAFSPVEAARGLLLESASEEDCEREAVQSTLEAFVENAEGAARLPALRRQEAWLTQNAPLWKAVLAQEEERFTSRVVTLFELNQVRARTVILERTLVQAEGEAQRLEAKGYQPAPGTGALVRAWLEHGVRQEQRLAGAQALSFWSLRLGGGVVVSDRPVDWYGLIELNVHLGALVNGPLEKAQATARAAELQTDRAGVEVRVRELLRQLGSLRAQARRELKLIEGQLESIARTREALERAQSPNVAFAISLLTCDQLVAESERIYLAAFVETLSALLEEQGHG